MNYKEKYAPKPMAVNSTLVIDGVQLGGFVATTAGTITIIDNGITYLSAHPVSVGQYLPLPMGFDTPGITVTLGGGACISHPVLIDAGRAIQRQLVLGRSNHRHTRRCSGPARRQK